MTEEIFPKIVCSNPEGLKATEKKVESATSQLRNLINGCNCEIEKIIDEIEKAEMSSAFNRKATPEEIEKRRSYHGISARLTPKEEGRVRKEGEAGIKKSVLIHDLILAKSQLESVVSVVSRVLMNYEASRLEYEYKDSKSSD
jgi:hypothetical protein